MRLTLCLTLVLTAGMAACGGRSLEADLVSDDAGDRLGLKTMIAIGDPAVNELKALAANPETQRLQARDMYVSALQKIETPAAQQALAELGP